MPAARSQEVTVRRPRANSRPHSSTGKRTAERLCSQRARLRKAVANSEGRCDDGMAGSSVRGGVGNRHRHQGAGLCPPTGDVRYRSPHTRWNPVYALLRRLISKAFAQSTGSIEYGGVVSHRAPKLTVSPGQEKELGDLAPKEQAVP